MEDGGSLIGRLLFGQPLLRLPGRDVPAQSVTLLQCGSAGGAHSLLDVIGAELRAKQVDFLLLEVPVRNVT